MRDDEEEREREDGGFKRQSADRQRVARARGARGTLVVFGDSVAVDQRGVEPPLPQQSCTC
jgi:hypothetical protein